jgi:hypothetical protein
MEQTRHLCCLEWNSRNATRALLGIEHSPFEANFIFSPKEPHGSIVQHATFNPGFARRVIAVTIVTRGTRSGTLGVTTQK